MSHRLRRANSIATAPVMGYAVYADLHFHAPRNQRWRAQAHQDGPASKILRSPGIRAGEDLHSKRKCGVHDGKDFSGCVVEENRREDRQRFRFPRLSHFQKCRRDEQDDCRESFPETTRNRSGETPRHVPVRAPSAGRSEKAGRSNRGARPVPVLRAGDLLLPPERSLEKRSVEQPCRSYLGCCHHHPKLEHRQQPPPDVPGMPVMRRASSLFVAFTITLFLLSCYNNSDPNTLLMLIDSSPTNLDPRVGVDAQSERIDSLIFDYLVVRGADLNAAPGLAERWEIPDPLTYIFHLHHGVRFHDGSPLTSRDVKWTFDSLLNGKIRSTRASAYRFVDHIDAPDDFTVIFHMREPDSALLRNLTDAAVGIRPSRRR